MIPLVAIEVPVGEPPADVAIMVEACTSALEAGRCVVADAGSAQSPTALAVVSWPGADHLHARVEVGQRTGARREVAWTRRDLSFSVADSGQERWRSVGYTIATIIGELEQAAPRSQTTRKGSTAAARTAERARKRESNRGAPSGASPWAHAGPLAALDRERVGWGGFVAFGAHLPGPFIAEALVAYSGSASDGERLSASRWLLGAYVGLSVEGATVQWRLTFGPALERVGATVEDDGQADSGGRWLPGLSARVVALHDLTDSIQVVAAASATQLTGATDVRVRGRGVSRIPAQSLTLGLGVGVKF